jgi:VWFA-related protein
MDKVLSGGWLLRTSALLLLNLIAFSCDAANAQVAQPSLPSVSSSGPEQPAAQVPEQAPGYTLSVLSEMVVLDVSVNDTKGQPVPGLTRNDFTILEDGIPQKIIAFEATKPPQRPKDQGVPIHSTAELDRLEPDAPVSIIVLDELTTKFEDEYFARYSLEKYLSKQGETLTQPMMLVARTVTRTMVLHDYTTSKSEILDSLKRHLVGNDWRAKDPSRTDEQVGAAFASLIEMAKATQGHRGHKNLIWIGRGFPTIQWANLPQEQSDALQSAIAYCTDLLRDARVTLYALDPAGVSVAPQILDQNGGVSIYDPFGGQVDFEAMARMSGGQALHGRNDVDHLIGTAVSNGETFYTVGYRPASPVTQDSKKFRKIQVVLKGNALVATSRQGYYSVRPTGLGFKDEQGNMSQQPAIDPSFAITGLMVFDGVSLTITRDSVVPDRFQIAFPAADIGLKYENGKMIGDISLIVLSYDRTGKVLNTSGKVYSLRLAALQPGEVESRKVQISTSLDTQAPAARMRFVIQVNTSGKIGADNFFLVDRNTLKDPATGIKAGKAR